MAIKYLRTEHYIAIGYLAYPDKYGLSYGEVAKRAGVSRKTLHTWRQDPLFQEELKRSIRRTTLYKMPEMLEAMAQAVMEDGNAQALELVLQLNNMLPTPGLGVEERLDAIIEENLADNREEDMKKRVNDYRDKQSV